MNKLRAWMACHVWEIIEAIIIIAVVALLWA